MNQVTKIHLARQAFTISVDAHKELNEYIDAISKQVKDKEVVDEIELRMSELLTERGINSNKVILPRDVDYLKKQLGSPTDFKEDDAEETEPRQDSRRLFRDTDNGMIAGVAAGLAKYFGIDVLLIRLVFVFIVLITVGWGILLYILLWLLVPEAKTSSEKLQMAGKAVTVKSLKKVVEQADVKGAARRANNSLSGPINTIFSLILKIVGVIFVAFGLSALFGLIASETYYLTRGSTWNQYNIFPIGLKENILWDIAVAVAVLITIFIILFGISIFRRKWPIKPWATGVLVGLLFIGLAVGGALTADIYPTVRDVYNANTHSTTRIVQPFTNVAVTGEGIQNVNFVQSDKNMVTFSYYDHPNINAIKTTVSNNTLEIDSTKFKWKRNCNTICFPVTYLVNVTVYSPNANQLENQGFPVYPYSPKPVFQN